MCGRAPCDKPDCTWSEAWRFECECRHVLSMSKDRRADWYKGVQKARGEESMERLKNGVKELWQQQNSMHRA